MFLSPIKTRPQRKKSLVLVMVLWLIMIMAVFGVGLARIAYSNYRFAKFRVNEFLSLSAIKAVVAMCKYSRIDDAGSSYDGLAEFPSEAEYVFGNIKVIYTLIDEEGRINVNRAPSSILKNLPDINEDKARAITSSDFRPFRAKEALLLIDEIDKEDYLAIKDLITIYGRKWINVNTCSEEALRIIGMKDNLIRLVMEFRKGGDDKLNTEDDRVFKTRSEIINTLKEEFFLSLDEEQELISFISKNMLSVESDNYRIEAEVFASNKLTNKYSIVFGKTSGKKKFRIKEWAQH